MSLRSFFIGLVRAGYAVVGLALLAAAVYVVTQPAPDLHPLLQVVGNLHPLMVHLPIGIFIYLVLVEFMNLILALVGSSRRITGVTFALGLGSVTAWLAAGFGLLLYLQGEHDGDLIMTHLWWGIGFAVSVNLLFMLRLGPTGRRWRYRMGLAACTACMMIGGHFGGLITHGDPLRPLRLDRDTLALAAPAEAREMYDHVVIPILEAKCYSCHSTGRKRKGGLLLDSYESILDGGIEGPGLVPGSQEDSLIATYIHLPLDDDLHMPPEGKPQLTEEEVALIDAWIRSADPETVTLQEAHLSDDLLTWVQTHRSSDPSAEEPTIGTLKVRSTPEDMQAAQDLVRGINEIEATLGSCISRYGSTGDKLAFTAVNAHDRIDDTTFEQFLQLLPKFVDVDLSHTDVTSTGVETLLRHADSLTRLNLSHTDVDNGWLASDAPGLKALEQLVLFETKVTPECLPQLSQLKGLKTLYLGNTSFSDRDIQELQSVLTETQIVGTISP